MRFLSRDPEQTRAAARALAEAVDDAGLVLSLVGPLGAGKTLFVKGLAEGLGVDPGLVSSPTFVIANEYPAAGGRRVAHVDLYRVQSEAELEGAGFLDLLEPGAVVAVEWGDRLPDALPGDRLELHIEPGGGAASDADAAARCRRLEARALGPGAAAALASWTARLGAEAGSATGAAAPAAGTAQGAQRRQRPADAPECSRASGSGTGH